MNTYTTFLRSKDDFYYYPFGNSLPEDSFLHHSPSLDSLSALYLGCGDLRNMLQSISELRRKKTTASLSFTLNDWQPEIVARNALLLFTIVSDPNVSPGMVARFWYSLELSKQEFEYWTGKMKEFLSFPSLSGLLKMDEATHKAVTRVMKTWLECDWTVQSMRQKRTKYLEKNASMRKMTVKHQFEMMTKLFVQLHVANKASPAFKVKLEEECLRVATSGVFEPGECVNPSMLLVHQDGSLFYGVHYGSTPFEGHLNKTNISLVENVEKNVEKWMSDFRHFLPNISKIEFNSEHAVTLMDKLIVKKEVFDVIETSNLADHVGLLNLLVSGSRLLKTSNESIIKTSSYLLYNFAESRSEYLEYVTGFTPSMYPTLLGLHLKEPNDEDFLSRVEPFQRNLAALASRNAGRNYEFFTWTKAALPSIPVSLQDSPIVAEELINSMEKLLPNYEKLDGPGSANITPIFYGKLLSFAFAEGRLRSTSTSSPSDLVLPKDFVHKIFYSRKLSGVSAETVLGLSLYSFKDELIEPPILISHIFDIDEIKVMTPALVLFIQTGPVQHIITSLDVSQISPNQIKVSCYLPGFIGKVDLKRIKTQMYYKNFVMRTPTFEPCSKWISVDGMSFEWVREIDWVEMKLIDKRESIFDDLRDALKREITQEKRLQVMSLIETRTGYEIKLKLDASTDKSTFKLKEDTANKKVFQGLYCDQDLIEIPLSFVTAASKVQIHRKSGFILLKLRKLEYDFPLPKISIAGLIKTKQVPVTAMTMMFSPDEVKANKSQLKLHGLDKIKFDMKENLHIIFVRANEGNPVLAIQNLDGKVVGMLFYHAILKHQPIDFVHEWTFMLDCSYILFEGDEKLAKRVMRGVTACQCLVLDKNEFEQFKRVMAWFEAMTLYKTPFSGLDAKAKRVVVMPMYESVVAPLYDANRKERKQFKELRNMQSDMIGRLNRGDTAGVFEAMAKMMENRPGSLEEVVRGFDHLRT